MFVDFPISIISLVGGYFLINPLRPTYVSKAIVTGKNMTFRKTNVRGTLSFVTAAVS